MLAVDTTTTSGTRANTGIQRVTRELTKGLSNLCTVQPLIHDPGTGRWKEPDRKALARIFHQEDLKPGRRRGIRGKPWTSLQQLLEPGRPTRSPIPSKLTGFIEPEIFNDRVHHGLGGYLERVNGPSLALYYDSTPLKLPELSPRKNTGQFPVYLRQLLQFDAVAAISESSKDELDSYWNWLGIRTRPVVEAIPLAVDLAHFRTLPPQDHAGSRKVLCVGSIEGRKNQVALLQAAEKLWENGHAFDLVLLGLASRSTSGQALELLNELQGKGRSVKWMGPSSENDLRTQYATCHFTVYPSLAEGFGLPVLESLKHGKPCICSSQGAIGEISTQGGCHTVEQPTPNQLAGAMEQLLTDQNHYEELQQEARGRDFRTWSDYAKDIFEFHKSLSKAKA